ncbi:MAG: hypothetical protein WAT74_01855 [Flavobacteriales bacterium]
MSEFLVRNHARLCYADPVILGDWKHYLFRIERLDLHISIATGILPNELITTRIVTSPPTKTKEIHPESYSYHARVLRTSMQIAFGITAKAPIIHPNSKSPKQYEAMGKMLREKIILLLRIEDSTFHKLFHSDIGLAVRKADQR